jgi:predicted Zn-ribbon and HTH transcriptional regulator
MKLEVQDIFRQFGADFLERHKLSREQYRAFMAISNCRTAALGAHSDACDECGYEKISYNSCRNRHCPKCGTLAKEEWLDRQSESLLNCGYFHVVFTVPSELNPVFYQNQRTMYGLLFKAASETLLELCSDDKFLGAKIGVTAVLHTWGQNLSYHPHLHCVVTGGGLTKLGKWVSSRKKFLVPLRVLAKKFRGKFLALMRKAELEFFNDSAHLNNPADWSALVKQLYKTNWITYCKPPFGSPQNVLDYLGRYTHRVAISNNRLVSMENGAVTFKYRDYYDDDKQKLTTLSADEFIRRFLMHILPSGFRKIRHFGILAARDKSKRIKLCKKLTDTKFTARRESPEQRLERIFGKDFNRCPRCKRGRLSRASP